MLLKMSFAGIPFALLSAVWPMADNINGLDLIEPSEATTAALEALARCGTVASVTFPDELALEGFAVETRVNGAYLVEAVGMQGGNFYVRPPPEDVRLWLDRTRRSETGMFTPRALTSIADQVHAGTYIERFMLGDAVRIPISRCAQELAHLISLIETRTGVPGSAVKLRDEALNLLGALTIFHHADRSPGEEIEQALATRAARMKEELFGVEAALLAIG